MRLLTMPHAPNVWRVQMFMREKRLDIPLIIVDRSSPEKKAAFRKINPLAQVPVLETDEGVYLSESLTICQYLDSVSGVPYLFGELLEERTQIAMWERRAELSLFNPAVDYAHHTLPSLRDVFKQVPEWAETLVPKVQSFYEVLNDRLAAQAYLASDQISAADITAYVGDSVAGFVGLQPREWSAVQAWRQRMAARASAKDLFPA